MEPLKKVEILQKVEMRDKGKLILSRNLTAEIDYLHKLVGSIEWIGILFYTKEQGELSDPNTLVLRADRLFLMDIGTAGHTEAVMDSEEVLNMYDQIPNAMQFKQGLIHTHHTMAAFFSGEDWSELNDNVGMHHYYLSLIVNNSGTYVAKVAYVAQNENIFKYKNSNSEEVVSHYTSKVMVVIDLDIMREDRLVEPYFADRYGYIKKKVEDAKKPVVTTYGRSTYASGPPSGWADVHENDGQEYPLPEKKEDQGEVDQKTTFQGGKGSYYRKPNDTLTYAQAKGICLDWLNEGLRLEAVTETKPFVTVSEAIDWFADYFRDKFDSIPYIKWTNYMQRLLVDVSAEYQPSVTAKRVEVHMKEYTYGVHHRVKIAKDLAKIAEVHPTYISILRKNEKKNRKNNQNQQKMIEGW